MKGVFKSWSTYLLGFVFFIASSTQDSNILYGKGFGFTIGYLLAFILIAALIIKVVRIFKPKN